MSVCVLYAGQEELSFPIFGYGARVFALPRECQATQILYGCCLAVLNRLTIQFQDPKEGVSAQPEVELVHIP